MLILPRHSHNNAGFSLVEIMVGMVIGMLGIIVILQIFALFEGQKRSTTGGSDVQSAGAIALYGLQRDIQQSGYVTGSFNLLGCNIALPSGATVGAAAVTINPAAAIVPAGDPNTDTLLVTYANSNSPTEGDGITSQPGGAIYAVQTPGSFAINDWVIAEPAIQPVPCNLGMDRVAGITAPNITVATGAAGMTNGTLYNMGQAPKMLAYAIREGNLTVCDYMANNCGNAATVNNDAIWVPIATDIVSMRAQYGRDTGGVPMTGIVNTYDQATPTTACGWLRAPAVRIALVGRNAQFEKTAVTTAAPTWAGNTGAPIDLTATTVPTGATWENYRYKVFQTTIPLRNTAWMTTLGVQAGC